MDLIREYLPFFIPLIIIQIGLAVAALIHIFKHPNYRFGNRVLWIIIVLFVNILGPVLYFIIGRGDD